VLLVGWWIGEVLVVVRIGLGRLIDRIEEEEDKRDVIWV
jgi:hypothetical protein